MISISSLGLSILASLCLISCSVFATIDLDINDPNSIRHAAAKATYDMMSYYDGNKTGQIPGKIPGTWWEGGAMFMTLIQYWHWTGDDSYNNVTTQGMLWQAGEHDDYMPSNWSNYLGNDDQVFWGLAAITGAELQFPDVPGQPSWLELSQGVYNTQVQRWDTTNCQGGLRWQIWPYQAGYTTKNAISNGGLFQLAARLARYTNNETYAQWAEKIWDWSTTTPLLNTSDWYIADTTSIQAQCRDHGDLQWTYNYGTYLMGAVYMYNLTNGDQKWRDGVDGLLQSIFKTFFPSDYGNNIMSEVSCESIKTCDRNQLCFKTFLSTWLAFTTLLAPYTTSQIQPKLQASAQGAAKQCSGAPDGQHCGLQWYSTTWDGWSGLEVQMSNVGIFASNMIFFVPTTPVTATTGGSSKSDPSAGLNEPAVNAQAGVNKPITAADRAGAGILTVLFMSSWLGMITWMIRGG